LDNADLTSIIAAIGLANLIFGALAFLCVGIIPVFCFWRIYEKAGYAPQWSLFAFIPGGQIVLLLTIALLEW
jgi:hypothetical protein